MEGRVLRRLSERFLDSGAGAKLAELASPFAGMRLLQKSFEKNVLTPKTGIWYHAHLALNRRRIFTR
jgi:hypothetical protein